MTYIVDDSCVKCKSVRIRQLDDMERIAYAGNMIDVTMEYSVCDACDREFVSRQQILNNDYNISRAKARANL
jgi:HTH-type transcriptional regulator/antitoxin MqsA